ncbi:helix-turn-helix transcriptional regulator [Fusibacter sp. JL216-2]|uniref:helix-turn-helix transcriptional regulator n=1 Tax=Fusibacter sp. JL216-2 TaxID=3071453 RepID=UPI003D33EF64
MGISKALKAYIPLADMMAESFGNNCEVVIHDLTAPQNSVVYVANGTITDRRIGQSFDHLIREVLLSKDFKKDYKANYTFKLPNGKKIKSSTSLIRDSEEKVIGAFCINFDIDTFINMQAFMNMFLSDNTYTSEEVAVQTIDSFDNVSDIIDTLIENTVGNVDIKQMKRSENIELVRFMHDKGIFLAKGSVDKVAKRLQVSPVTVYSYLDEIKKKKRT